MGTLKREVSRVLLSFSHARVCVYRPEVKVIEGSIQPFLIAVGQDRMTFSVANSGREFGPDQKHLRYGAAVNGKIRFDTQIDWLLELRCV